MKTLRVWIIWCRRRRRKSAIWFEIIQIFQFSFLLFSSYVFGFLHNSNINYVEFFQNGIRGAKEYLMHESPESSSGARLRIKIFLVLDYLFRAIVYSFLLRLMYKFIVHVLF